MANFETDLEVALTNARNEVFKSLESSYGANVIYAKLLNVKWSTFDWFELKHNDSSDSGKVVKKEGDLFRKGIKNIHSNPSQAWKQVRDHARNDRYGVEIKGEGEGGGEGEGEGKGGTPNHNRSPELRNIEDLTILYKFNRRQESLSPSVTKCYGFIGDALIALGVDLNMIAD